MEAILFWICGVLLVLSAMLMVVQRNTVAAGMWMLIAFMAASGVLAALAAPFLAFFQVFVYAGAVLGLFLMAFMLVQAPVRPDGRRTLPMMTYVLAALPAISLLWSTVLWVQRRGTMVFEGPATDGFGSLPAVSRLLLGRYLPAFELACLIVLPAVIGWMALVRSDRSRPWKSP